MNTFLAITAAATTCTALGFWVAWLAVRIDRANLEREYTALSDEYDKQLDYADRIRSDRNRLLKRVAALSAELHAVPNIPDPVAALRDLVERFRRIGGLL